MIFPEGLTQSQAVRPYAASLNLLRDAGLRPTRQRLSLAKLLFSSGEARHVTAEKLHEEALADGVKVSLATVYNTLHQFTEAGLLNELVIDSSRIYFDTNTDSHHHFYNCATGALYDVPKEDVVVSHLPQPPKGARMAGVHVVMYIDE
ncbi:transcriptional repressor [Iodidimonas gelatinilytica]|uniref:Ferric uptake regulation protein n=1 Tax=Iodidimonas gelatinilytica TaxID=1236966 RepID=A0A5A7MNB0_9PROT|nr:Fur family transcriptional regulator [Iodidimonas gelatinilytica]GEQ97411.1 transcriptional repressor [Iodidimonas gelatinilytica]GER02147.1 transcriptional repressor [Iodidimonas gelatinilytica]